MLPISNLHVFVGDKPILKGLMLEVRAGEAPAKARPVRGIIERYGLISGSRTF